VAGLCWLAHLGTVALAAMTLRPLCSYGVAMTGNTSKRCKDRAVAGSMYCADHLKEALRRVKTLKIKRVIGYERDRM